MVRIWPCSTPAIARSTRKLSWTAGVAAGTAVVSARSLAAVWSVAVRVVPASTVRQISSRPGVKSVSIADLECAQRRLDPIAAAAKYDREKLDKQASTTANARPDAGIAGLVLEGTGPGEVRGVESA